MRFPSYIANLAILTLFEIAVSAAIAADVFERPPIEYSRSKPENRISQLQARLDRGELKLKQEEGLGYLRSLLKAAEVPVESQTLVFSQTSMQRHRISPQKPRAIYFNDDVYVGFCQSGNVLEISAVDPKLGTVFYTLDQEESPEPRFLRQTENCMVCHSSSRTEGVPGLVVRSLFVDPNGQPILSEGSYSVDHSTPLEQRWGGWYVTGTHGSQTHLGNLINRDKGVTRPIANDENLNVTALKDRLKVDRYLSPHSDIVALMILEHQTIVHNRLTKANFAVRQALYDEAELNRALDNTEVERFDSTTRRIQSAGDDLVDALLLVDEAKIAAPISGTSNYSEVFSNTGPRDKQGRSLRDLDLSRRIFKYPCSFLIYSEAFDALDREMREYVWKRLWEILHNNQDAEKFAHLSPEDRRAIVEIIRATKPDLPDYWR